MANISALEEQYRRNPSPATRELLARGVRAELLVAFKRYHDLPQQAAEELAHDKTLRLLQMFAEGKVPQGTGATLVTTVAFRSYVSWRRSRDAREWRGSVDLAGTGRPRDGDVPRLVDIPVQPTDIEEEDERRHRLALVGEALHELSATDRALIEAVYLKVPPSTVEELVDDELRRAHHGGERLDEDLFRRMAYERIGRALRRARERLRRHVLLMAASRGEDG